MVVDNGSRDGSAELLAEADDAGLCELMANDTNVFHGPALNQALSWLAGRRPLAQWVWVLDSDCVVARPDTLFKVLAVADAALVGEPGWDPWHQYETLGLYSLLLVPLGCGDRRSRPSPPVAIRSTTRCSLPGQPGM